MSKLFLLILLFQSLIAVSEHHGSAQSVAPPIAGGTTPAAPSSAAQEFLDAHNKAIAEVGVGPLKWSIMLANATSIITRYQRDKHSCSFANLSSINYGQLQLLFRGLVAASPQVAVDIWVAEKKFYNYANNSCIQGRECFSYTQVVWKNSLELGCGQATCSNNHAILTICFYNPPGNLIGEKPY